jgi:hypothetical protein
MESLARAFDQPLDSPEHRELAENGWIGGENVTVRYWLGRLLRRNLFRESNDAVEALLQQYFIDRGQKHGAGLVSDHQSWSPLAILLRHHVELSAGLRSTKNPRLLAALDAVMTNPDLNDSQLAKHAKTTEKQIARMTDVFILRKIWKHRQKPIA